MKKDLSPTHQSHFCSIRAIVSRDGFMTLLCFTVTTMPHSTVRSSVDGMSISAASNARASMDGVSINTASNVRASNNGATSNAHPTLKLPTTASTMTAHPKPAPPRRCFLDDAAGGNNKTALNAPIHDAVIYTSSSFSSPATSQKPHVNTSRSTSGPSTATAAQSAKL